MAIDGIMQIDQAAAAFEKLIKFGLTLRGPAGIVGIKHDHVGLCEFLALGPAKGRAHLHAISQTKQLLPTLLPERIIMLAWAVVFWAGRKQNTKTVRRFLRRNRSRFFEHGLRSEERRG